MPEVVQAPCGLCLEERWVARLQVAHRGELIPMALCWRCLMELAKSIHLAELGAAPAVRRCPQCGLLYRQHHWCGVTGIPEAQAAGEEP